MYAVNKLAIQESERQWDTEAVTNDLDNLDSWASELEAWSSGTYAEITADCAWRDIFDPGPHIEAWHEFREVACSAYDFLAESADDCEDINVSTSS